ncbi:MAG: anaerobic ribonucleoside-triphosphate reductase activating protein [Methanomicrobiales archaeon]|nr:anaerobic ribonucleoside-triphosphate reductase activating protein [Methanomicrobiales archaeon]
MDTLRVNFGGFIPISTVDWPGRAVCTVFFRGCPVRCSYCQNATILNGEDFRDTEEILALIKESSLLISGVVFSGGEPTMQQEPLISLARAARAIQLGTAIHTNGVFPAAVSALLTHGLIDRVALDIKARWERYDNLLKYPCVDAVRETLALCREAKSKGELPEFEVVVTLFRGYEDEVPVIAKEAGDVDLVLQQGVVGTVPPLSEGEMRQIGDRLGRMIKIRTREGGEVVYEGSRDRWAARER